jgi:hypothetical protein
VLNRVVRSTAVCAFVVATLAACGGGSGGTVEPSANGTPASGSSATGSLTGPRTDAAVADLPYEYVPEFAGSAGATVAFAVENKPAWATFDESSGILAGTPTAAEVGRTSTVRITATAGGAKSTLEFELKIVASAVGTANVSLDGPQTRTDGSALSNLAGYRIYYGKTATRLDQFVDVNDRAARSADIERLTPGTWYFAATALDVHGFESELTSVSSKTIG